MGSSRRFRILVLGLLVLPMLAGCGLFHHNRNRSARCADPQVPSDVQNMPALKVEPGMTAPDTRNAVVIPPAPDGNSPAVPAAGEATGTPCLSLPPSYKG